MVLPVIKKRRSIRQYLDKKVEREKLEEILKAAMFAPTAKNKRAWEFIVVEDKKTIRQLSRATKYSSFIKDAPVVIVICANQKKASRWIEDCAIAAENIYLEATNQGLGTCMVQIREGTGKGEVGDPEKYLKEILEIPENIRVLCLMPLGYPKFFKKEHQEEEFDRKKIHWEKYGE